MKKKIQIFNKKMQRILKFKSYLENANINIDGNFKSLQLFIFELQ